MKILAKEIIPGRFWILVNDTNKVGTVVLQDNKYILSDGNGKPQFASSKKHISDIVGTKITWGKLKITETIPNDVYGFPTKVTPYNIMYDVQNKLPLFTKSPTSKSYFCAGYYLVKFNVIWLKSYCPKLITLERNEFLGPWKTGLEQKLELSRLNAD
jgi:hypothetical protein